MTAQATNRPSCPKCKGNALYPWFTIVDSLDHVKCLYCGWQAYTSFSQRKPTAAETRENLQKGIAKSRRVNQCLND